jgi:IS5 family transposase
MNTIEQTIVNFAFSAGAALVGVIADAINAGDVNTVKALTKYLPEPEQIRAKDLVLQAQQRRLAEEELRPRTAEARRREEP